MRLVTAQSERGVVHVEVHLLQVLGLVQQLDDLRVEVDEVAVVVLGMLRQQRTSETGTRDIYGVVPAAVI